MKPADQTSPALAPGCSTTPGETPPALAVRLEAIEKEIGKIAVQMESLRAQDDISGLRRLAGRLEDQLLPEVLASMEGRGRDLPRAHLILGLIYRALGRKAEAGIELRKADELEIRNPTTRHALTRLTGEPVILTQRPADVFALSTDNMSFDCYSMIFDLSRRDFESLGWRFQVYTDTHELVKIFTASSPRPALLIVGLSRHSDSILDAVRRCQELHPSLKVLVAHTRTEHSTRAQLADFSIKPDILLCMPHTHDLIDLMIQTDRLLREAGCTPGPMDAINRATVAKRMADRLSGSDGYVYRPREDSLMRQRFYCRSGD